MSLSRSALSCSREPLRSHCAARPLRVRPRRREERSSFATSSSGRETVTRLCGMRILWILPSGEQDRKSNPRLGLVAWIVGRVDVLEFDRPYAVKQDHRLLLGEGEVILVGRHQSEAADGQTLCPLGIQLVTHSHVKLTKEDGNQLILRMGVSGNFVVGWESEAHRIESVTGWVALQNLDLRPWRQHRRCGAPLRLARVFDLVLRRLGG